MMKGSIKLLCCFVIFNCYQKIIMATDYCDEGLCRHGKKHIACGNDGKLSKTCPKGTEFINLYYLKDVIEHEHNKRRQQVASGKLNHYLSAERMGIMKWDENLAYLAGLNVKTCKFGHDQCRNTPIYNFSGQNLAYYKSTKDLDVKDTVEKNIELWYAEYKDCDMSVIKNYHNKAKPIGHFTGMIGDNNTRVGCAAVKMREGRYTTILLGCNYARTNMRRLPIYVTGPAGSKCITGVDPKYPPLCSEKEPLDPNYF